MSDFSEGLLTGAPVLSGPFGWIPQHHIHEAPPPVGRENWSVEVNVLFLMNAVRVKIERLNSWIKYYTDEANDADEARLARDSDWRSALRSRFRLSDELLIKSIVMEHQADDSKERLETAKAWLRFLSAMPTDGKVKLDYDDFLYFFPNGINGNEATEADQT